MEALAVGAGHRGIFDDHVRRLRIAERHLAERPGRHQLAARATAAGARAGDRDGALVGTADEVEDGPGDDDHRHGGQHDHLLRFHRRSAFERKPGSGSIVPELARTGQINCGVSSPCREATSASRRAASTRAAEPVERVAEARRRRPRRALRRGRLRSPASSADRAACRLARVPAHRPLDDPHLADGAIAEERVDPLDDLARARAERRSRAGRRRGDRARPGAGAPSLVSRGQMIFSGWVQSA